MVVVVFDADVLIGFLSRDDAHHAAAVDRMRRALRSDTQRVVSAVNYTEVLIGPLRTAGGAGARTVDTMLTRFGIETIPVDMTLAKRAGAVRVRTTLKLPDAYAVATAVHAEQHSNGDVRLETFDEKVAHAYSQLRVPGGK
ncbi:MAG: PIN domain-containing protein [Actinobacteria bacterium]|nr:PIN domain-containing protein [Actinomycetota bacterium]